jgi:hypothetical protein
VAFAYYARLSRRDQRIYRQSDRIAAVPLADAERMSDAVADLARALATGRQPLVEQAAERLVDALTGALGVPPVAVRVLAARPQRGSGELHGLYTSHEARGARVELWMRTAARRRVVAFPTFLRTLLHELCHHLDYTLLGLEESFHTEGFFRRESSLFRQLVPRRRSREGERPPQRRRRTPAAQRQLELLPGG